MLSEIAFLCEGEMLTEGRCIFVGLDYFVKSLAPLPGSILSGRSEEADGRIAAPSLGNFRLINIVLYISNLYAN